MKKFFIPLILVLVLILSSCTSTLSDEQKDKIIISAYTKGDVETAKRKAVELYKDDESKAITWLMVFNETENKDYKDKLIIQDGWTWKVDKNYSYVKGRVKNTSDKDIRYFEVTVEYLDSAGKVLDSDYTNSGETLRIGNQKEFEIMHKNNSDYEKVRVFVNEVRTE